MKKKQESLKYFFWPVSLKVDLNLYIFNMIWQMARD